MKKYRKVLRDVPMCADNLNFIDLVSVKVDSLIKTLAKTFAGENID